MPSKLCIFGRESSIVLERGCKFYNSRTRIDDFGLKSAPRLEESRRDLATSKSSDSMTGEGAEAAMVQCVSARSWAFPARVRLPVEEEFLAIA